VDFVLAPRGGDPLAIECTWSAQGFDPAALLSFRRAYPAGDNFLVAQDVDRPMTRRYANVPVTVLPLPVLLARLRPVLIAS
jgi:hypothetical protein